MRRSNTAAVYRLHPRPETLEVVTPCAHCGLRMPVGTPVLAAEPRGTTHADGGCERFWWPR